MQSDLEQEKSARQSKARIVKIFSWLFLVEVVFSLLRSGIFSKMATITTATTTTAMMTATMTMTTATTAVTTTAVTTTTAMTATTTSYGQRVWEGRTE